MDSVMYHHGIKGQKWGIRRFQNPDGTWTNAGKERYGDSDGETRNTESKASNNAKKKVAISIATGTAVVAGAVLTAYMVKKYGGKNVSEIADKAPAGKEILQDILKSTSVGSTHVSQITASKDVLKKGVKASATAEPDRISALMAEMNSLMNQIERVSSTSQIPVSKAEPKQVLEKTVKAASSAAAPISRISTPRVSVNKPASVIASPHTFESLMRQNDDLLKKMLAELA